MLRELLLPSGDLGRRRPGMTLIELLMAMTIASTLLVALSVAFHSSLSAVTANDAYSRATDSARMALNTLTSEIRQADAVEVSPAGDVLRVIRPADLRSDGEVYREFSFDPAGRRLMLKIFGAGDRCIGSHDIVHDLSACSFGPAVVNQGQTPGQEKVVAVPVLATGQVGSSTVSLSSGASPRRLNQW